MRLKKLQIVGFKSFAEKVSLLFESGITAIVGPNGCGKSNIADAIRWVLGEQSAKSMRGSRMPDVIFAGTAGRKPLGFAEVSITFIEVEGVLPVDYEEVSITRRLHRSGESEYLLNGRPIRLKDLQDLFLDSGIGKNSFSIFEQGKIDQIIHYTPLERRYIFEETAGILRFLQRKRETLHKLQLADQNLERVRDIHEEVEKQIVILSEQAGKAEQYKQLTAEFEFYDKALLVAKAQQIEGKKAEAFIQQEAKSKALELYAENMLEFEAEKKQAKAHLEAKENELKRTKEELLHAQNQKEQTIRDKDFTLERLKDSQMKEKRWKLELEDLMQKRNLRKQELLQAKALKETVYKETSDFESTLKQQRTSVFSLELELTKLQQEQKSIQKELFSSIQKKSHFDGELKQARVRIEASLSRQGQLQERKEKLQAQSEHFQAQITAKEGLICESNGVMNQQRENLKKIDEQLKQVAEQQTNEKKSLDAILKDLNEHLARQKALLRLRHDFEGFSSASKRLLQASQSKSNPLYGRVKALYEYIIPEEGFQDAVSTALHRYSQTLVVDFKSDAELVLAFAKKEKLTDFSLIVAESLPQKSQLKSTLKSLQTKVKPHALAKHFLENVFLSENFPAELPVGVEVWCTEELFIDGNGVFFHGIQGKNNAFFREAEIKAIEVEVSKLESQKEKIEKILQNYQQQRSSLHAEMVELDKNVRRNEMQLVELNFALQRLKSDVEKNKKEMEHSDAEWELLQEAVEKQKDLAANLEGRLQEALTEGSQQENKLQLLEVELQSKQSHYLAQKKHLQETETISRSSQELLQKSEHAIQIIEIKENESLKQEKRLQEELRLSLEFQSEMRIKVEELEKVMAACSSRVESLHQTYQRIEKATKEQKKALDIVEGKILEKHQQIKKEENEQQKVIIVLAELEAALQSLDEEALQRYECSLTSFEKAPIAAPAIEIKLRNLRRSMEAAGDINMTSIEECKKQQTRYDFLTEQIEDLKVAKEDLLKIISELDRESRKLFKNTFEAIAANFKKNFSILFNGGEADLQFTEHEDLLEAGIEIIAKPPGKQMKSISLLSGGEKCLTAIALLFAIFEVKAGPFCILDEIDAPLDDANVERFVQIVKQFVDRTQFVIITHNKQTMAMADVLFGVSMQEKGISKLLQMEFAHAESA